LRNLATRGLTAAGVLAFLHHRRVVPLKERPLCIFEMTEEADPVALARSRMLPTPLGWAYALTRARNAVDTRMLRQDRSPWDLEMLPTGPLVSVVLGLVFILDDVPAPGALLMSSPAAGDLQRREVGPAYPSQERAACRRERARRRRERRERRSEEYRLREQ
jgi:hypothetical protein